MTVLPIVGRELAVAARRPGTYWLRSGIVLIMLIVWFSVLTFSQVAPAEMGQLLLAVLIPAASAFALFAGVLRTADCLSEEKREGTLGLLFLTDLRTYDIILGKLAAAALQTFFCLVATFPVLALPLLLGGVTGREFWRLLIVLVATLFFSLCLGLFVSAFSHDTRQALLRALSLVVILTGLSPVVWWIFFLIAGGAPSNTWLLLPSPAFACLKAFGAHYFTGNGPAEFWLSLKIILGLSLAAIDVVAAPIARRKLRTRLRLTVSQQFQH